MSRKLLLALTAAALTISAEPASAEPFLGDIKIFAFDYCPDGWIAADGRLLPIQQNQALFVLFATNYGGNGTTTFAVPKVTPYSAPANGRSAVRLTACIAGNGFYPSQN